MTELILHYWPHILAILSVVMGLTAAIHATMTKQEVRTAIGWVGVIILSPILGAVIYAIIGVNRIRRKSVDSQRRKVNEIAHFHFSDYAVDKSLIEQNYQYFGAAMSRLGDKVSRCNQTSGNYIEALNDGDLAYEAMLDAIANAKRSILLESYIFDRDPIGIKFVNALADAVKRGIAVRVLIDAVGARYSFPSVVHLLKQHNVPVDVFNGNIIIGLRLPYANLRTHRKIMIVDGAIAFTGGMNIRVGFSHLLSGDQAYNDTHFRIEGPAVADLFHVATEDWIFTTNEKLTGAEWAIPRPTLAPGQGKIIRIVPSGPDRCIETNHKMLIGAFSLAQKHIRIKTPYLLPDREIISALVTAARRGVRVDIVIPGENNLKQVDRAMRAQFDQLLQDNCNIWRAGGTFNHSKLMVIDDKWAYVGTSNMDARSLRLNFEVDMEVMDYQFAQEIAEKIDNSMQDAQQVLLQNLINRPFTARLLDRVIWLFSPYL